MYKSFAQFLTLLDFLAAFIVQYGLMTVNDELFAVRNNILLVSFYQSLGFVESL